MWACRHSKDQKDPSCSSMFIVLSVLLNAYQFISILFRMSTINLSYGKHTKHLWNGCKSIYFFNYPDSYGFSSLPANLLTWSSHFCMISASSSLILCSNNHTKMIITKIIWVLIRAGWRSTFDNSANRCFVMWNDHHQWMWTKHKVPWHYNCASDYTSTLTSQALCCHTNGKCNSVAEIIATL